MKGFLLIVLALVPTDALASVDSTSSVFDSSFRLGIVVEGWYTTSSTLGEVGRQLSMTDMSVTVDPTDTLHYKRTGDTIMWNYTTVNDNGPGYTSNNLRMILEPASSRVLEMSIAHDDNYYHSDLRASMQRTWGVSLASFNFDSISIWSNDSSLAGHKASPGYHFSYLAQQQHNNYYQDLDSVVSVSLSGVFSPITLRRLTSDAVANAPSSVPSEDLSVDYDNSSIECHFTPSDKSRTLFVYTRAGSIAVAREIPGSISGTVLPSLASGLYFVCLGGEIQKVLIP